MIFTNLTYGPNILKLEIILIALLALNIISHIRITGLNRKLNKVEAAGI